MPGMRRRFSLSMVGATVYLGMIAIAPAQETYKTLILVTREGC